MAYEIISIGDGEILANTFRGAAMIFGGGHLNKLIIAGFMMGIMGVCVGYLMSLEFKLYQVFVGLVIYLIMFVPKDTVAIEDLYAGEVRVVDNVPIGVAVPMSIISNIGIQTTILFESVFSTPDEAHLINNGYMDSLNVLMALRNMGIGSAGSTSVVDGDVGRTLNEYIDRCVALDMEMNRNPQQEVTRESLLKSTDLLTALRVSFVNIDVMLYLPNLSPLGEQRNCVTAYQLISAYLTGNQFNSQLDRYAKGLLHINDANVTAAERIDNAANALNLAGLDAQTYMRNAVLTSYLQEGPSALITRPAKEQLNLQWASEQSMFNQIERPLMAFVEMFVVAISPIVAFLTTLGAFGLQMMVRYLQLIAWISLWGPLMAVCNLFIAVVTTRALASVDANAQLNGTGLDSMAMHDQFYQSIEVFLSTGSMLAASVPALALMIVYGGSVTATNLAGRMTSGASSSIKPERSMPEVMSMAPVQTIGSFTEGSRSGGFTKSGMADSMNNWGSQFAQQAQSAHSSVIKASQGASETASQMNQHSKAFGTTDSRTSTIMSGVSEAARTGGSYQSSDGRTHSFNQKATDQVLEQVNAGVNAGAKLGFDAKMIGASTQAQLISKLGMDAGAAKEWGDLTTHQSSIALSAGNESTSSSGHTNEASNQAFERDEQMSALAKQYQAQVGKVLEANEAYSIASSLQQSYGTDLKEGDAAFAQRLFNSGASGMIGAVLSDKEYDVPAEAKAALSKAIYQQMNSSNLSEGFAYTQAGQTLGEFKKLQHYDPAAAMKIFHDYLMPAVGEVDAGGLKHDSYQGNDLSPNGIMSDDKANGISNRAGGGDLGHHQFGETKGGGRDGNGSDGQTVSSGQRQSGPEGGQHAFELNNSQANRLIHAGAPYQPYDVEGFKGNTKSLAVVQMRDEEAAQNPQLASFEGGNAVFSTDKGNMTKPVVVMDLPEDQVEGMISANSDVSGGNGQSGGGATWYENIEQGRPVSGSGGSSQQGGGASGGGRYQGVSDYYGHLRENHKPSSGTASGDNGASGKQGKPIEQSHHETASPRIQETGNSPGNVKAGASLKATVEQDIGSGVNSADVDKHLANGGHLDRNEINPGDMMYRAAKNHPVEVGVEKVLDNILGTEYMKGKNPIIDNVGNAWDQSVDSFKEIIGNEKHGSHHESNPSPSENNLPPIKE